MDVSTPPSLDLACPQAEADIETYVHMFRDRGVNKIKYGHAGIMIMLITTTYICHMITQVQVMTFSQSQSMNQKPY